MKSIFAFIIFFICTAQINMAQVAAVKITVIVPANTPQHKQVYIAGSFNHWHEGDSLYRLHQTGEGQFSTTLPLFDNMHYEYKYTLGSWSTVETDSNDSDIHNRVLISSNALQITDTVIAWKKETHKTEPSSQMIRINAMKDSTVVKLKPQLAGMIDLLKSYVQNWLLENPRAHTEKKLNKKAEKKLNSIYEQLIELFNNVMATFTPEQKTELSKLINTPEGQKDFLNTFQHGIQKVTENKK